jgi:hypothetical protein
LRASLAELKAANVRLAMGVSTAVDGSTSFPAYDPGSYSAPAGSWDVLTFGGEKTVSEIPLTFVHTRPDGKVVVVVLYSAVTEGGLNLPFNEEEVTLHDVVFKGLADADRSEGDQVGFFAEQVATS